MAHDEVNTRAQAPLANFDVLKRVFIGKVYISGHQAVPNGPNLHFFDKKLVRQS